MSEKGIFAAVRCKRINNIQGLSAAGQHARRLDKSSPKRVDASRTHLTLTESTYLPEDSRNVLGAFKAFKGQTGAKEQKGASMALHLLLVVSPEWIDASGDRHDPNNPRNRMMFSKAKEWAEKEFGEGSVICSRMDMDEKGGGVVDVFVCPTAEVHQKGREPKKVISTRKALLALQKREKRSKCYRALQDSYARHCQQNMDPNIKRGELIENTQKQNVHADIMRPALESAKKIKKQAYAKGASDFADQSLLGKVASSVDWKRKKERKQGEEEGSERMRKRASRVIGGLKKENSTLSQSIQEKDQQVQNLKDQVKTLGNDLAAKSEPDREAKRKEEFYQTLVEQMVDHDLDHGINPIEKLKEFQKIPELPDSVAGFIVQIMKMIFEALGLPEQFKPATLGR